MKGNDLGTETDPAGNTGKFLTFRLAGEDYGIHILNIREIIGMLPVTSVPGTPSFVLGVINLRGKVIPIIDLRLKFSMDRVPCSDRTCIIVVELQSDTDNTRIGIVVDGVSEVVQIRAGQVESPPAWGKGLDNRYIRGLAKMKKGVKILLDIDRVLSPREINAITQMA